MKALKAKRKKGKYKPKATPSTTIFRKGSASSRDDLTNSADIPPLADEVKKSRDSLREVSLWVCSVKDGCGFIV
jgi:hypothetical protein